MAPITVRPRYVAAPWDPETLTRIVGLEDDVRPEEGPLADYRSVFPDRAVRWDYHFQSFAIYQLNPGEPEQLVERLTYWDSAPDPETGRELTDEQIATMAGRTEAIVRRFMPFDDRFVQRRLQERLTFLADGEWRYLRRIADRNATRSKSFVRHHANQMAAAGNEIKHWIPVLSDYERTGRWNPGMRPATGRGASFAPRPAPTPAGIVVVSH